MTQPTESLELIENFIQNAETTAAFKRNAPLIVALRDLVGKVEKQDEVMDHVKQLLESPHIQNNKYRMGLLGRSDLDSAVERLAESLKTTAEKEDDDGK